MHDAGRVRNIHACADVDAVLQQAVDWQGVAIFDFAGERMRREVLHRNGVVALDAQEVIDADDVAMSDFARIAQFMHKALEHFFVFADAGIKEL